MAYINNRIKPVRGRGVPQPPGGGRIGPPLRYPGVPGVNTGGPGGPGPGNRVPPPNRRVAPGGPGQAPSAQKRKGILTALQGMNPNQRKDTIARAMYRRRMALNAGFKVQGKNG